MTSELRPAVEVWRDAAYQYGGLSIEGGEGESLAAAVIEADREAVRAEQATELAKWKALAETLAGAVEDALRCTAQAKHGAVIFDCGDPYEIMTEALTSYKEQRDD